MVKGVFDELEADAPQSFSVGIHDDVNHNSIDYDPAFSTSATMSCVALFSTARVGWHGGREQEQLQDHR